ncbi:purine nucleoside phosphorylase YfiH [Denitratisoma sp. agr-D3]
MTLFIAPDWPAPARVRALSTTRASGFSLPPYDSLNLGHHVADDPVAVRANRYTLQACAKLPAAPLWLEQVHGSRCLDAATYRPGSQADAIITDRSATVCAILTADCLPLLFCTRDGRRIGAAHAGWRGLADGVIESTLSALGAAGDEVLAWLGPAIGPAAYEVGGEVRSAFLSRDPAAEAAFQPSPGGADKWLCDLYHLARLRLRRAGVAAVYGGDRCTWREKEHFFSYRRDGVTGRQASLIWLTAED